MKPALLGLALVLALAATAAGAAGTDRVAQKGMPVAARPGWPAGTDAIVNDPARGDGWNHWFSGLPNDVDRFELEVGTPADVDRLVARLAAVKVRAARVVLDARGDARRALFPDPAPKGPPVGALFSVGHQPTIDAWFRRLKEVEPGVREFGVSRLKAPPAALPPTLTLYARHPAVALDGLRLPAHFEVEALVFAEDRKAAPDDPVVRAIDRFVAAHKARRVAAAGRAGLDGARAVDPRAD